jgi:hypothetical protein
MEVLLPSINTSSSSTSYTAIRPDPEVPPPTSPYSNVGLNSSAPSINRFSSTGSFTSLAPGTEEYHLELERLKIQFRNSQQNLHLEQERSRVQREQADREREFYELERTTREARHQQEIQTMRQQFESAAGSSKRRK